MKRHLRPAAARPIVIRGRLASLLCAVAGLSSAILPSGPARAQDPEPLAIKPNVLLIVDTSGSMEYRTGSDEYPTCNPDDTVAVNERSRWIEVVEALTGTIRDYSCESVPRDTSLFEDEFAMPGNTDPPPDLNYRNPYHRPLSAGCAITPDRSPAPLNAFEWVPPLEADYPVDPGALLPCATPFSQNADGFIDSTSDLVRFGLMTFDSLPNEQKGHDATFAPNYAEGVEGAWSYYGENAFAKGHPADCEAGLENSPHEVGVRNGAAPASEGRMIYFGDPNSDNLDDSGRHDRLQKVLLATRPFGATPINGALDDARFFLQQDTSADPLDATLQLSPQYDDYVNCGCRDQHIILITDGEPNLDLRPHCEETWTTTQGVCPYPDDPVTILEDLYTGATEPLSCDGLERNDYRIPTHVVGYSTSTYDNGSKDCADLKTDYSTWNDAGGFCETTTDDDSKICCTLHQLASAGSDGNEEPYIAPDGAQLKENLSDIVASLVQASASATRPVRSPGVGLAENDSLVAFRILTSFETDSGDDNVWRGNVERLRWECVDGEPVEQERDLLKGDDFGYSAAKNKDEREFVSYLPSTYTTADLLSSLRPHLETGVDDGVTPTNQNGVRVDGQGADFADDVTPVALDVSNFANHDQCEDATSDAQCRDQVMDWLLGYSNGVSPTPYERCADPEDEEECSVIGDVMHSNPVIVDRPVAPLEDVTYETFAEANKGRMMMMYTSSNDGMLHGFAVSPNDSNDRAVDDADETNEQWAFIAPYLLPQLKSQYPANRTKLLDGTAVVQDVVATGTAFPYKLERSATAAGDGNAAANTWRTILVQGFGGEQSGYFALDVTDAGKPSGGATKGPRFLWQLTTTTSGKQPLFGTGGTPTIATVNLGGVETAVAILPGGKGGSATGTGPRSDPDITDPSNNTHQYDPSDSRKPRENVNQYAPADVAARSLTIVRLDTGEVLRSFRNSTAELSDMTSDLIDDGTNPVYLDSPITGIPAAFPAGPGMIADRVFVGDQDGVMWRVDVSPQSPADWTMKLFYDAYDATDGAANGQPITTAPTLSVNNFGQITVAYGTGSQDLSGGNGDIQYFYSLTEGELGNAFISKVNWYHRWTTGEHVLGPVSLLNGVLYYTTVDPSQGSACEVTGARIYGEDYVRPKGATPGEGGFGRLAVQGESIKQSEAASTLLGGGGGEANAVFGVSLEYTPSCYEPTTANLDYVGGSRKKVGSPSKSQLQLVFQTGTADTSKGDLQFRTGFESVTLAPQRRASNILSWAAILD